MEEQLGLQLQFARQENRNLKRSLSEVQDRQQESEKRLHFLEKKLEEILQANQKS